MSFGVNIQILNPEDEKLIQTIADWYFGEWETPKEHTVQRLLEQNAEDVICHMIAFSGNTPVATGGVYYHVNLHNVYPDMKEYSPCVGLMYTVPEYRRMGIGRNLLTQLEKAAHEAGVKTLYLYTATAESLYENCGWSPIKEFEYKGMNTVLMKKDLE